MRQNSFPGLSHRTKRRSGMSRAERVQMLNSDWPAANFNVKDIIDMVNVNNDFKWLEAIPSQIIKTNSGRILLGEHGEENKTLAFLNGVLPPDERATWRDVGMALHSLGWDDKGYELWT